jgi:hypothetical protein
MKESDPLFKKIHTITKSHALTRKIIGAVKKYPLGSYGKAKRKNTRKLKVKALKPTETKRPSFFKTLLS